MNGESFCRPVISRSRNKFLLIGLLAGVALFFVVARFMGWLTF
jgi:hypothetical protein